MILLLLTLTVLRPEVAPVPPANGGAVRIATDKDLVGRAAGVALDQYKLRLQDLDMIDEPPGKLQAVAFRRTRGGKKEWVTLWLRYTPKLFSMNRKWKIEAIRAATVRKITVENSR
jgi:hypothetical protein